MESPEGSGNARGVSTNILSQWPRQLGSNSSWVADGGGKN